MESIVVTRYLWVVIMFIVGLHFMSCAPAIQLIYGVHKPKYRSDETVARYYQRLGQDDIIYRIKNYSKENRKQFRYLGNSMPDLLLFNSQGQLTKFVINCTSDIDSIAGLSRSQIDQLPLQEKGLEHFVEDTYTLKGLQGEELGISGKPLYVVKFAEYAGKLNRDNVPSLIARLHQRSDVEFIVLNMDYTVRK